MSKSRLVLIFAMLVFLPLAVFGIQSALIEHSPIVTSSLTWKGWVTIVIFILTFAALVREAHPPDITMMVGAGTLMIFGILTPSQLLEGFSNDVLLTIAMLCVLVRAVEVNGILEIVARKVLSKSRNFISQMLSLTVPVAGFSAFLNNTPITLLMAPIVRKWALNIGVSPSKFLIPLSYATILGGVCTIIGTSTNLIVQGLLERYSPQSQLSFFELAWVGVPCVIVGLIYLVLIGKFLLPDRLDPTTAVAGETREFTAEFVILRDCPLVNRRIKEVSGKYFPEQFLIQVERNNTLIDSPARDFMIHENDRLVFAGDINHIAEVHAIPGVQSLADPHFKLDVSSSHFSEVVIATSSTLIGRTLKEIHFRTMYGASVLAVYRQGKRVLGKVSEIVLQPGDTLMLLSSEAWQPSETFTKDFYFIRNNEKLLVFNSWKVFLVIVSLICLIITATLDVPIAIGSTIVAFFLVLTRCVSLHEAQKSIVWNILLLIGFSFAFGKAMETTGVAALFAELVLSVIGNNPIALIGGILFITILGTEFMSNNASALIFFPIAIEITHLSGYDSIEAIKAVGVAVAVGSSCGFAIPTGYQTHMIVYGPGGYKFKDFLKVGIFLDIIILALGTLLIPLIWPLK